MSFDKKAPGWFMVLLGFCVFAPAIMATLYVWIPVLIIMAVCIAFYLLLAAIEWVRGGS